jgi:hypothetical protein
MITQSDLKAILDGLSPSRWCAWDWRKLADGRVVRFVNWRKAVRHA